MKKYYLTNNDVIEIVCFSSDAEAFAEAQKRNHYDENANWKAWNQFGDAIYGVAIIR
jgi:hypothetical protein